MSIYLNYFAVGLLFKS